MNKLLLLDLFSGAGGAARGYQMAGFHVTGIDHKPQPRYAGDVDTTVKGTIAEGYVKVKLAELGFDVWEPVAQNHKTDLVILTERRVIKIQVKAAGYDLPSKAFRANLTRHRRGGGLPTMEFYVIPASLADGNATPRLFPHREKALSFGDFSWETYRNAFDLLK